LTFFSMVSSTAKSQWIKIKFFSVSILAFKMCLNNFLTVNLIISLWYCVYICCCLLACYCVIDWQEMRGKSSLYYRFN
jgi:hypothetical protein